MENWTMFIDFVLIAGMALLFLLILFVSKAKPHFSKNFLIIFFVNSFFFLLYYYAFLHRSKEIGAVAILFGNGSGYLLGPATYFYLKALIFPKKKIYEPFLKHLIPFFIHWIVISVPVAISMATPYLTNYGKQYADLSDYLNILENIYFGFYLIITYRFLKRIRKASLENFSTIESADLFWFHKLLLGLMGIIILDNIFSVYELVFPMIPWNIGTVIAFLLILLYGYLGYKGIFQSAVLLPDYLALENKNQESDAIKEIPENGDTSTISNKEAAILIEKLTNLLQNDKVYLNDDLRLTDLADAMNLNNRKLSELLNKHLQLNFYTLINKYRVAEVKAKIRNEESEKYTLLSLAYDSGFQSKASFNRIFKKETGMSPSKYRSEFKNAVENESFI